MSFFVLLCFYLQEHRVQGSISGLYHTRCMPNCYDEDPPFANTWPTVRYVFRASHPEKNFEFLYGTLLCTYNVWRVVSIFMAQRPNTDKILTYSISVRDVCGNFLKIFTCCSWLFSPSYLTPYSFCIFVGVIFCLMTHAVYKVICCWR